MNLHKWFWRTVNRGRIKSAINIVKQIKGIEDICLISSHPDINMIEIDITGDFISVEIYPRRPGGIGSVWLHSGYISCGRPVHEIKKEFIHFIKMWNDIP